MRREGCCERLVEGSPLLARSSAMRTSTPSVQEKSPANWELARVEQVLAREPFAIALGGRGIGRACMHTDVRREGLVSNDDFIKTVSKTWVIMRQVPESHAEIKLAKLVISFLRRHLARASHLAAACTSFQILLTFPGACRHCGFAPARGAGWCL